MTTSRYWAIRGGLPVIAAIIYLALGYDRATFGQFYHEQPVAFVIGCVALVAATIVLWMRRR
ncbi:MAG: hypothetical protein KDE32_16210 [Novosphingobium sp.]|nr:hypothetical protein [Novosphingobium sp.]